MKPKTQKWKRKENLKWQIFMCKYVNAKTNQYKDGKFAFQSFIKFLGFVWVKKKNNNKLFSTTKESKNRNILKEEKKKYQMGIEI